MTRLSTCVRLTVGLVRLLLVLMGARIDLAPPSWRTRIESVSDDPFLDHRGIYAWYADAHAQGRLRRAGVAARDRGGLVYIGKTTTRFRRRLQKHIAGVSTLRKTLRAILIKTGSTTAARADSDVSRFMHAHFRVAMLPMSPRCLIDAAEGRLIRKCSPLINITHNPPNARIIKDMRRRFARARLSVVRARGRRRGWVGWSLCRRVFRSKHSPPSVP